MPLTMQTVYPEIISNAWLKLLLLVYILMSIVQDYVAIHLWLI